MVVSPEPSGNEGWLVAIHYNYAVKQPPANNKHLTLHILFLGGTWEPRIAPVKTGKYFAKSDEGYARLGGWKKRMSSGNS
ncbi:Uncharacterised protein [Legionella busanensis]|uniref:Uncharacterized protein n=1 Tax=Legionella busanensis TaxID=190655 RepID=A0A378KDZ5_9GAMM|nr:Uncharacterised protein [Legionella busanensis]